jgi:predicted HNH restriction endonuclease
VGDWQGGREKAGNLPAAQAKLDELMGKLQGPAAAAAAAAPPAMNKHEAALADAIVKRDGAIQNAQAAREKYDNARNAAEQSPDKNPHSPLAIASREAEAEFVRIRQIAFDATDAVKKAERAPAVEAGGKKLTEGVSSLWDSLQSPIAEAQMAAQGMWDRGKIKADATMGTLAGAMQAGSQDAYSTIVQAMIRQADPVVKAVREQTKEQKKSWNLITQTIKEARPKYLAEFGGM